MGSFRRADVFRLGRRKYGSLYNGGGRNRAENTEEPSDAEDVFRSQVCGVYLYAPGDEVEELFTFPEKDLPCERTRSEDRFWNIPPGPGERRLNSYVAG